jgi:hypothetical protein
MKKDFLWMLATILLCSLSTISCTSIEDNPVVPVVPEEPADSTLVPGDIDEFADMPGNAGDPAVVAALQSIENIEDLKPFMNQNLGQAYYFNYKQLVDHDDPSQGTFKQQVVLTFVGKDANTILHTEGYALAGDFNYNRNRMDKIGAPHLLWALSENYGQEKFDLNCVQVEYRYHGFSLPEGDKNSFMYLNAWQQSQDLHAIVTDLKKALITGNGKWLSTGLSKNGVTTAQYAYYDEQYGWNDIDVYVPFAAPFPPQAADLRIGTYMITESSKAVLPALEKAYRKLVDDQAIANATVAAFANNLKEDDNDSMPADSAFLYTLNKLMKNLFSVMSYGDIDTWSKFIPTEKSTPEEYADFFMLNDKDDRIFRKSAAVRGPLASRDDPFYEQTDIDQGNLGYDYKWYLDGKLLSDSDKKYFMATMDYDKKSKQIDLQIALMKNLETTKKKLIFVYGENDPWTGAAIPDPTNPNVKKYIVPNGTHTDDLNQYAWYPGGKEVADKIINDIKAIMNP